MIAKIEIVNFILFKINIYIMNLTINDVFTHNFFVANLVENMVDPRDCGKITKTLTLP